MKKVWILLALGFCTASLFAGGKSEAEEPFERRYRDMRWGEIVAEAEGQTLYFYMWGGADYINNWVSGYFSRHLAERSVNITNLQTEVIHHETPLYVMMIEVEM